MNGPAFWWNDVTGPASLVAETADALRTTGAAMLALPAGMPWRDEFRDAMEETLRDVVPWDVLKERMTVGELAVADRPEADPGTRLLERFALNDEVRFGYRPKAGRTIQDYLADRDVLRGRLVWLAGLDAEQAAAWLGFAAGRPRDEDGRPLDGGMLLLETDGDAPDRHPGVPVLIYGDFVRRYDAQVFADFLVAGRKGRGFNGTKRELLAAMAAEICGTDAELMTNLLSDCDAFLDDPVAWTDRLRDRAGESGRLAGLPSGGALAKAVWAAQMKTIFPLLELERKEIVDRFVGDLELALKDPRLKQYDDKQIERPEDLEIGQLSWCVSQCKIKGLTGVHSRRVHDMHALRNAIAHGQPAPKEELYEFLETPFDWRT